MTEIEDKIQPGVANVEATFSIVPKPPIKKPIPPERVRHWHRFQSYAIFVPPGCASSLRLRVAIVLLPKAIPLLQAVNELFVHYITALDETQ